MPLLSQLGIVELTVGVLSGWLMVLMIESPESLVRIGVRHPGRIRQAHLDVLFQGVILVAVGLAVDPLPTWIGVLLIQGAFLAPLLLGVLAFNGKLQKGSLVYRAINTVVLVALPPAGYRSPAPRWGAEAPPAPPPIPSPNSGEVAQLVEHTTENRVLFRQIQSFSRQSQCRAVCALFDWLARFALDPRARGSHLRATRDVVGALAPGISCS